MAGLAKIINLRGPTSLPNPLNTILHFGEFLPQSNQSAGPVRFLIFFSISIFMLASPVAGRKPQWTAGAD